MMWVSTDSSRGNDGDSYDGKTKHRRDQESSSDSNELETMENDPPKGSPQGTCSLEESGNFLETLLPEQADWDEYEVGDFVMAKWHSDNVGYPAIVRWKARVRTQDRLENSIWKSGSMKNIGNARISR